MAFKQHSAIQDYNLNDKKWSPVFQYWYLIGSIQLYELGHGRECKEVCSWFLAVDGVFKQKIIINYHRTRYGLDVVVWYRHLVRKMFSMIQKL